MRKGIAFIGIVTLCVSIIGCVASVRAMESYYKSALVGLEVNQYHGIIMDDCPYQRHQGGAKATSTPANTAYIQWKLLKKNFLGSYREQATDTINNLSTTAWSSTSSFGEGTGNFAQQFYAKNYSYRGNVEVLNF